jgi:ATP-binding cassette subfamily B protein
MSSVSLFVLECLKPFRFWIFAQTGVGILWAIDLSLRPYILKIILDKLPYLSAQAAIGELSGPIAAYIGLSFFIVVIFRCYDYIWLNLNPPLKRFIGDKLMTRLMLHSHSFFQNHFAGNLGNKVKDVMSGIPDFIQICIDKFFAHTLALVFAVIASATVSYKFALGLCVWVSCFMLSSLYFAKRASYLSERSAEVRSSVVGQIVDILGNMMNVRFFTGAHYESIHLRRSLDRYVAADQQRDWYFMQMFAVQGLSFVIYQAVCLVWLMYGFAASEVTPGDFALIITVNISLVDCLWSLSKDISHFAERVGNIRQGLRIALAPLEIEDKPEAKALKITKGEIDFENVEFSYKGAPSLFENKSVHIAAGQKVGLVGYSGGGKSTFVNLILRLYEVSRGSIRIDGQDIKEVSQESLREVIGMIPQEPSLFHRSLYENIHYGRSSAKEEEVMRASKKAHAHEFIMDLPMGYDSLVGERGVKLSGGQRQRIAIARAILKNAPILILDEATSQLDSLTENEIQESLWELMQGKTTLVIAHRLSTLLDMDRILVFDSGKIVQDGSHQELLTQEGLYKTLWQAQVGGFLPDKKIS